MKEIEIKKLIKKRREKSFFSFLIAAVFIFFAIKSYSEEILTEVKYNKIQVNSIEDVYKKERDFLYSAI